MSRVLVPGSGGAQPTPLPADEFLAGVGEHQPQRAKFDHGVLAREARLDGRDGVTETWPLERIDGLSKRAVSVELGEGLPAYTFDLGERATAPMPEPGPSIVPPDPFADVTHPTPGDQRPTGRPAGRPPAQAPDPGMVF